MQLPLDSSPILRIMADMEEKLAELGISKSKASRYFGVSRGTVLRWCSGSVPSHVTLHLDYLISCHRLIVDLKTGYKKK